MDDASQPQTPLVAQKPPFYKSKVVRLLGMIFSYVLVFALGHFLGFTYAKRASIEISSADQDNTIAADEMSKYFDEFTLLLDEKCTKGSDSSISINDLPFTISDEVLSKFGISDTVSCVFSAVPGPNVVSPRYGGYVKMSLNEPAAEFSLNIGSSKSNDSGMYAGIFPSEGLFTNFYNEPQIKMIEPGPYGYSDQGFVYILTLVKNISFKNLAYADVTVVVDYSTLPSNLRDTYFECSASSQVEGGPKCVFSGDRAEFEKDFINYLKTTVDYNTYVKELESIIADVASK